MKHSLIKCESGIGEHQADSFSEGHTQFGKPICNWCGHMWIHDCH